MKILSFVIVAVLMSFPVLALPTEEEMQLPPISFRQMTYLHPNGCLYSRTDPAGHGRRWIAVTNASFVMPGAKDGPECTTTLIQPPG